MEIEDFNEDCAYLFGVLLGDGSINIRVEKGDYEIKCVGNPKDEKEYYLDVIAPLFTEKFGKKVVPKYHDKKTTYGIRTWSKEIVSYLITKQIPSGVKYTKLKIPKIIGTNRKLKIAFIQGLFDTDGCCSIKKQGKQTCISCSSKSSRFMSEVSKELRNLGFHPYETYNRKVKDCRLKKGYSIISSFEICRKKEIEMWINIIGSRHPKHLKKFYKWKKKELIAGGGFEPPTFTRGT